MITNSNQKIEQLKKEVKEYRDFLINVSRKEFEEIVNNECTLTRPMKRVFWRIEYLGRKQQEKTGNRQVCISQAELVKRLKISLTIIGKTTPLLRRLGYVTIQRGANRLNWYSVNYQYFIDRVILNKTYCGFGENFKSSINVGLNTNTITLSYNSSNSYNSSYNDNTLCSTRKEDSRQAVKVVVDKNKNQDKNNSIIVESNELHEVEKLGIDTNLVLSMFLDYGQEIILYVLRAILCKIVRLGKSIDDINAFFVASVKGNWRFKDYDTCVAKGERKKYIELEETKKQKERDDERALYEINWEKRTKGEAIYEALDENEKEELLARKFAETDIQVEELSLKTWEAFVHFDLGDAAENMELEENNGSNYISNSN